MLYLINELKQELEKELNTIDKEHAEQFNKAKHSIGCIINCLQEMRSVVCQKEFNSIEDEIHFFKIIKPSVFQCILYFKKIMEIESEMPAGAKNTKRKFLKSHLKKINRFYNDNRDFCRYMRSGMTYLDATYFTREDLNFNILEPHECYHFDPSFSTNYDFKASCLLANDKLSGYLDMKLSVIPYNSSFFTAEKSPSICWTDSKIGLTELIYALQSSGCFNNGKADIKEIAHYFFKIFSIQNGDYYRDFQEIKNRKNPTKFLETLQNNLNRRIEKQDEL